MTGAKKGFTIVELLIVIVVIGILATITVVAYSGIQHRARDTQRRADVSNIAKTLTAYAIDNDNDYLGYASGCGNKGSGYWMGHYYDFPSIQECLINAGYASMEKVADPSGCDVEGVCVGNLNNRYMKLNCTKDATDAVYVLAYLDSTPSNASLIEGLCDNYTSITGWGDVSNWDTVYGINYAVRVK